MQGKCHVTQLWAIFLIVEFVLSGMCPTAFQHFHNNSVYIVKKTNIKHWDEVRDSCYGYGHNVHPVAIETEEEQEHIAAFLSNTGSGILETNVVHYV